MPIDVQVGDSTQRVAMDDGAATLTVEEGTSVMVDPQQWVLRAADI
jgi:hypothetical protein